MRKLFLVLFLMLAICSSAFATSTLDGATSGISITDANATHGKARAVWIGTTQSLDFSFDGTNWVTFQGASAGEIIPIQVVGARITSGNASPNSGDVVFLY